MSNTMGKTEVMVGIANMGETSMEIADILKWEPTKISCIGSTTYFKVDDTFYSMTTEDFKTIFTSILK